MQFDFDDDDDGTVNVVDTVCHIVVCHIVVCHIVVCHIVLCCLSRSALLSVI